TWSERARAAAGAVPALVAPVLLLGGILVGVFTPTEAAAVAVGYLVILGLVSRVLTRAVLGRVLATTARNVGAILVLVAAASLFGRVMTLEQVPQAMTDTLTGLSENPAVFLGM